MLNASIRHGSDGYRLVVSQVPMWAVAAEAVAESACARLGHALCRGIWPIGFRLGQRLLSVASRREQQRWTSLLTDEQVHRVFPGSMVDSDDM